MRSELRWHFRPILKLCQLQSGPLVPYLVRLFVTISSNREKIPRLSWTGNILMLNSTAVENAGLLTLRMIRFPELWD